MLKKRILLSSVVFPLVCVAMTTQQAIAMPITNHMEATQMLRTSSSALILAQAEPAENQEEIIVPSEPEPEPVPEPEPEPEPVLEPEVEPTPPAPEVAPEPEPTPEAPVIDAVPEEKPDAPEPAVQDVPVPEVAPVQEPSAEDVPVPEVQPNPAPGQQASEAPVAEDNTVANEPIETAPEANQTLDSAGQAPTDEPVPVQAAPVPVEAAPMTKEELKEAVAVAKDPAKTTDTIILPVDKGAAVLDSDKEAELLSDSKQVREDRRRDRENATTYEVPKTDAEAQSLIGKVGGKAPDPVVMNPITKDRGERVEKRPEFARPAGVVQVPNERRRPQQNSNQSQQGGNSINLGPIILQFGDRTVVRGDDNNRFVRDGGEAYYERLPRGRVRETIERADGSQVVTIRNRYGDVIQRSRIDPRGREYVLFYAPELDQGRSDDYAFRDPGIDLPPMRLRVPLSEYIIDTTSDYDRDYADFLQAPPVEPVERVYSLDEVRYSARIRDKVRRIDLDTITFATASADIPMAQAKTLRKVAEAINQILDENPAETFLIEGHSDAVGSDSSNLILSDERAESVANLLTDVYGIPPENLATQGYGERYLKVKTQAAEQQNRRVTIRRITPLVRPIAQN